MTTLLGDIKVNGNVYQAGDDLFAIKSEVRKIIEENKKFVEHLFDENEEDDLNDQGCNF